MAAQPPPVVLIGFAEALAAIECAWSLLESGFRVVAFARRGRRVALRRCRNVRVPEITPPELDAAAAVEDVVRLATSFAVATVLPMDDAAVWLVDCASKRLAVPVAGPTGCLARLAIDKRAQLVAARAAGFDVLPAGVVDSAEQALSLDEFPLILKPALAIDRHEGRLRRGRSWICADRLELERAVAEWAELGPLIVQPFVRGIARGVFGLAAADGVYNLSAHERIRMMNPAGSGASACRSVPVDSRVAAMVKQFVGATGWRGLFMIEFLQDMSGRWWFVELNGRAFGSMALARRQGLEYPAWAVAKVLHDDFVPPIATLRIALVCRHLGRELVHVLIVFRGLRSRAITAWPSRVQTLLRVLRVRRSDRWYNYRRGDVRLFLQDVWETVRAAVWKGGSA